jgi:hypothetical protein
MVPLADRLVCSSLDWTAVARCDSGFFVQIGLRFRTGIRVSKQLSILSDEGPVKAIAKARHAAGCTVRKMRGKYRGPGLGRVLDALLAMNNLLAMSDGTPSESQKEDEEEVVQRTKARKRRRAA